VLPNLKYKYIATTTQRWQPAIWNLGFYYGYKKATVMAMAMANTKPKGKAEAKLKQQSINN
jgi:hypothetical protein